MDNQLYLLNHSHHLSLLSIDALTLQAISEALSTVAVWLMAWHLYHFYWHRLMSACHLAQFQHHCIYCMFRKLVQLVQSSWHTWIDAEDQFNEVLAILSDLCPSWIWVESTRSSQQQQQHRPHLQSLTMRLLWAFSFHGWGKVWTGEKQLLRLSTAATLVPTHSDASANSTV